MDLNHILNTEPGWKGGRPSSHRPKAMEYTTGEFTTASHDPAIHQKSHRVNAYSLQPQSEHKRNDTLYSLPPISSFDGPSPSLRRLNFRSYQYEPEQLRCSFPSYSAPRHSDLYAVQPRTSSVPTVYASDLYRVQPRTSSLPKTYASTDNRSSSADNWLTLRDLHIRPPRGVFDPSYSFQGEHTDIHQGHLPADSSMVSASDAQRNSQSKVESTSSNSSSTEVSPRTKPASSPGAGTDLIPLVGPKRCSYIKGCSTESPERKVTSHLFGRNKNCTKQIPDSVWLWYCRKHYQRTRYRDRVAFTKLQLDSVRRQVQRLRAWGGVREWEVILKKSEKTRLYNYTLEHAKKSEKNGLSASDRSTGNEDGRGEANPTRPGATPEVGHPAALVGKQMQFNEKVCDDRVDTDDELDSDDEDDEESNKVLGKNKNRRKQKKKTEQELPPLCHFMVPYLGRGKTFEDIEEVLKAVKVYLQGTDLPFPAIELLPYSETPALPRRASSATVRTRNPQPTAAAKRKASDSTSGSSDMPPPASRKRRSPADDDKDEVGDMATASPRKRRPVAGGSTNQSNTLPPPSPLKRRTSTRGRKSQLEPDCQVTQAKQAPNRGQASGGGRR